MSALIPNKTDYNCVIPQKIFQTWHSKLVPPMMYKAIQRIKKYNPLFKYYLFDDNDCREFIKKYFKSDVLNAFDNLIPGAYKADLWRYCVLFIHGGIYLDIKYMPSKGFKFINLCEKEHLVLDEDKLGIYNAFMVCKPKNIFLFKAIRQIVSNVQNKYYGESALSPTGPRLLSKFISLNDPILDMKHGLIDSNNKFIYYKGFKIIRSYNGHEIEKIKASIKPHYSVLWGQRNIYA